MTVSLTSFSRDPDRVHSVNEIVHYQTDPSAMNLYHSVALPITLEYNMEIVAKYMSDLEQILTTFSVIMNPDIYVVFPAPHNLGNLKTQIIWNGSVAIQNEESIDDRTPWRIIASTSFIVRTWLFPGTTPYDTSLEHRIKMINYHHDYYATSSQFEEVSYFGRFYNNRLYNASMDEFYDLVKEGRLNQFDELRVMDAVSGYYIDNIYGVLSGNIYDFNVSSDLTTLINAEMSAINVTVFREDGTFFTPSHFENVDWKSVWRRMLSGDLGATKQTPLSAQNYQYLISPDSYLYLLYDNFSVTPLV
jgi:hypothetical protein